MSRYTTFFLWCPHWEPLEQTNHPSIEEAIRDNRWGIRTPWCLFRGRRAPHIPEQTINAQYAYSTPETVQAYIDGFRCTTHGTPPEIWRRSDALERRQLNATREHYDTTVFTRHNAPEELSNAPYFSQYGRYTHYQPKRLGREGTLHFEWQRGAS